jgi:hypothetical protein
MIHYVHNHNRTAKNALVIMDTVFLPLVRHKCHLSYPAPGNKKPRMAGRGSLLIKQGESMSVMFLLDIIPIVKHFVKQEQEQEQEFWR